MSAAYDRTLAAWAKSFLAENVDEATKKLIRQANFDLYYGPVGDGAYGDPAEGDEEWNDYPGFVEACSKIKEALADVPGELFIDADCEQWQEGEPEWDKCEACDGGTLENGDSCPDCGGRGGFEPSGEWWRVERRDLYEELVGKELRGYVS